MAFKKTRRRKIIYKPISATCIFCDAKTDPDYKDYQQLGRFVTDRARILVRSRSGLCARHQRKLNLSVKHARHLGLLPYQARV